MKLAKLTSGAGMMPIIVLALASTLPAQAQTLTVLHNFTNLPDGARPVGRLLLDPAGNLYGTTPYGGTIGDGSVFKVDPSGNESIFYSFAGPPDGGDPISGLILDAAGNLYGTTFFGGTSVPCGTDQPSWLGCGTVFKLDPSGTETVLHRFGSNGPDGANPAGPLLLDSSGNLWGTTEGGGNRGCTIPIPPNGRLVDVGCGTVFKLDASGNESILYTFRNGTDGAFPVGGMMQDTAGNLYGTASTGGLANCPSDFFGSCGTVFKIDTAGQFSVFYSFQGPPDGASPFGVMVQDAAGNLYGTTYYGGTSNAGTIFKLGPTGKETVLYSFMPSGQTQSGAFPFGVVRDAAGNFYGLARGVVFKLDSTGKESALFTYTDDDDVVSSNLMQDSAGNLYGTTLYGTTGDGTVFKLTTPPDFAVAAFTLTPATVNAGSSASATLNLITVSGFNDTVTFACSVSPQPAQAPQCSVNATPGTPATVTVSTSGPSARATSNSGVSFSYALWLPLLGLVGIGSLGSKQRSIKTLLLGCVLCLGVASQVACGGGGGGSTGNPGTPAGAYTLTVTGTSGAATGSLVRSTSATLQVQ